MSNNVKHALALVMLLPACLDSEPQTLSAPPTVYVSAELSDQEFEQIQDASDMWVDTTKAQVVTKVVRGQAQCGIYVRYATDKEFVDMGWPEATAMSETESLTCVHELKLRKNLNPNYDKVRIFAHELGHILGGQPGVHNNDRTSLMHAYLYFDSEQYIMTKDVNMVLVNFGME